MSERDYRDYLADITQAINLIEEFTREMDRDAFIHDEKTVFAVIRCLEIIGEAVKRLPQSFRDDHHQVPWKIMAGMRDRLIHGYDIIDYEIIWNTIQKDIPGIKPVIELLTKDI